MRATGIHRIVTATVWPALLAMMASAAGALADETPPPLTTTWTNTVTTTAAQRLNEGAKTLGYGYPGGSGSSLAYDRGAFVPLRLDLLSEFEMNYGELGFRASGAARAERALTSPPADSVGSPCHQSSADLFALADNLCPGWHAEGEIREAFVHGSTSLGDQRLTVRLGRHTLIWGESVYFAGNGIAGGQAPIDTSMVEKISGYQGETVFLPVGQLSASWQPGGNLAIEAYYQFEWRPSRIGSLAEYVAANGPGSGYFAQSGGSRPNSHDQYGVALKWHRGDSDYGLYALRFDAKVPLLEAHPQAELGGSPADPVIGIYSENYPRGIEIYGMSVAGPLGAASYGAEISARRNMPLVTGPIVEQPTGDAQADYPAGDTLHAQVSWSYVTAPLPWVADGAKWTGEIAANHLLHTTAGAGLLSLDRTRTAAALRTVLQPQFLQVRPRLDLTVPIGLGVNFLGLSATDPQMNRGTGDVSIGLVATYDQTWTAALNLIHYFGTAKNVFPYTFIPAGRPMADADFVSLSVQRSF